MSVPRTGASNLGAWHVGVVVACLLVAIALLVPLALNEWRSCSQERATEAWGRQHLEMARGAAEQQDLRKAERIVEEAVKLDPRNPELRLSHLGYFVRRAAEQPQTISESDLDSLDYALGVIESGGEPPGAFVLVARARLMLRRGDAEDARKKLDEGIAAEPDYVHNYLALADLERSQGRSIEALAAFEKAVEKAPENLTALNNLGVQYLDMNRVDEGLRKFEEAIKVKDNVASRVNAADALIRLKRLGEAIEHTQRAAALAPESADIQRRLGLLLKQAGRGDDAEAALVKSLSLRADTQTALDLGNLYLAARSFVQAARIYAKLMESDPDSIQAQFGWAESLRGIGKAEQAVDAYRAYIMKASGRPGGEEERIAAARKWLEALESAGVRGAAPLAPSPGTEATASP